MKEPTYDGERARRLVELLRALATRIRDIRHDSELLAAGPELLRMMGDARSELFHYEVRSTYDTPEVAESRRIVEQAQNQAGELEFDESEGDEPWRSRSQ